MSTGLMDKSEFTATESRLLDMLDDGKLHHVVELLTCLFDADQGDNSNIHAHVTNLRKKLRPKGQDIICQRRKGGAFYCKVRLQLLSE